MLPAADDTCLSPAGTCAQAFYLLGGYCLQPVVHAPSRRRMREKYGLEEAPCGDCLVTFLCAGFAPRCGQSQFATCIVQIAGMHGP